MAEDERNDFTSIQYNPDKAERRTGPAIFMFQPTEIQRVETPEELQEWERLMAERVGIPVGDQSGAVPEASAKCYSMCPNWDDCDVAEL